MAAVAAAVRPASGALPDADAPSVTLTLAPAAAAAVRAAGGVLLRVLCKVYYCQQDDVCLFEQVCPEVRSHHTYICNIDTLVHLHHANICAVPGC